MKTSLLAGVLCLLAWLPVFAAEPTKQYRISGTAVSTRDGAPVPYCRMQIAEANSAFAGQPGPGRREGGLAGRSRPPEPTEVDADVRGRFQITLNHPGAYQLTGSARDYRRQSFDAHEGFFSSIVLTAAEPAANVVFRMERDASISGLVLDEAGEPVRNAQVAAEAPGQLEERPGRVGRGFEGRQAGFAQTDDRGHYELSGLAPGAYRVRVTAQPWYAQGQRFGRPDNAARSPDASPDPSLDVVYPITWFPGVDEDALAELILLGGGEERQADFHLSPSASVHLVVPRPDPVPAADGRSRPQRGAFIQRISPAGGGFIQTSTTNGTTQEFGGLTPGIYEIHTTDPEGRPSPEARQFRVAPGSSGFIDLSTATMLTKVTLLLEGVAPSEAGQLTFVDAGTGRTVTPNGGIGLFADRQRGDGDEHEKAVYLTPGAWEVHLPSLSDTYLIGLQAKGATVGGATLTVSDQPATLTLQMGSGRGTVSGIALAAGKPVEGAMVLLVPVTLGQPGSVTEVQRDQTNTDGSFYLRSVVPGKYILLAIDHGWGVKWRDLPTLAQFLPRGIPLEIGPRDKLSKNVSVTQP